MVTYEITATVDAPLAEAYERFLRERHVPDLLATGHFARATLGRAAPGRYRLRYDAPSQAALDAYLRDDAPRLRAHALAAFPAGVALAREVWTTLEAWDAPAATGGGG